MYITCVMFLYIYSYTNVYVCILFMYVSTYNQWFFIVLCFLSGCWWICCVCGKVASVLPDSALWKPRDITQSPARLSHTDSLLCGPRLSSGKSMRAWPSSSWSTSSTAAWPERIAPTLRAASSRWSMEAIRDGMTYRSVSPPSCADSRLLLSLVWYLEARGPAQAVVWHALGDSGSLNGQREVVWR